MVVTNPSGCLRVLVVDDSAMNRDIAAVLLWEAGHQVMLAEDGQAAVRMAAAGEYDVILMDVRMPGMDGLTAAALIRGLAGQAGQVPIVCLTDASGTQVQDCSRAGLDVHLSKPFTQMALLNAIMTAIRPAGAGPAMLSVVGERGAPPALVAPDENVLDQCIFRETCTFLAPQDVNRHIATIIDNAERLLASLPGSLATSDGLRQAAADAHKLAGSAGMFGFERICTSALAFEQRAASANADMAPVAGALARDLAKLLVSARREIAALVAA